MCQSSCGECSEEQLRPVCRRNDLEMETRGWKLLMLISRLLFTRPPRRGPVPEEHLKERVVRFNAGEWVPLLELSLECSMQGNVARSRRRRATDVSHARRAPEGEVVAPHSEKTWKALTDEVKRPRTAREGVDQELIRQSLWIWMWISC